MKAAPFSYVRATSLAHACRLLAEPGREARIIAGGQTLVPMMAMRLVRPDLLVDLNDVSELSHIRLEAERLTIGALTRQAEAERSEIVARHLPLLRRALTHVGHPPTRARGTIGGSLANADPAAEIALVAATLGASLVLAAVDAGGTVAERETPASAFFLGPMDTAATPQECLREVQFPRWPEDAGRLGAGFEEAAVRDGDFALVAAAAQVALDDTGVCRRAAYGIANAAPVPLVGPAAGIDALVGSRLGADAIDRAVAALTAELDPPSDAHASATYRRHLAPRLLARALRRAALEAGATSRSGP